jgi:hypothetical protein
MAELLDVDADEVVKFLFRVGIHPSELVVVDSVLEGGRFSGTQYRLLRRLMFLRQGHRNTPRQEVDKLMALISATRVRRQLHAARLVEIGVALQGLPVFKKRTALVERVLAFLRAGPHGAAPFSHIVCLGHGCRFVCNGVLRFIRHLEEEHMAD